MSSVVAQGCYCYEKCDTSNSLWSSYSFTSKALNFCLADQYIVSSDLNYHNGSTMYIKLSTNQICENKNKQVNTNYIQYIVHVWFCACI